MNKLVASALLSAATYFNPTTPAHLSFDASAFVTNTNKIRVSVVKTADVPVVVVLRNEYNEVLHQQVINKKTLKSAILFTLNELNDGKYELEIKSSEGSIKKQLQLSSAPVKNPARVIALN